ncbi:hypothetical protein CALCODRAFT_529597 [Calocera cornea HHB12733]|uniref:Uncharacterized protein n=1 Tax=Calocera cornea HHB12733 TaxID=1353952 RepID=A0A165DM90_9BASI|nr:hypothetical protein CALCODRAFT_529597 [Calocera cornea HHB12733]
MSQAASFKAYPASVKDLVYTIWNPKNNQPVVHSPPDAMGSSGDLCFLPGDANLWIKDTQGWRRSSGRYHGHGIEHYPTAPYGALRIQDADYRFRWTTETAYRSKKGRENEKSKKLASAAGSTSRMPGGTRDADYDAAAATHSERASEPPEDHDPWRQHAIDQGNGWILPVLDRWEKTFGDESLSTKNGAEILRALLRVPYTIEERETYSQDEVLQPGSIKPSYAHVSIDLQMLSEDTTLAVNNLDTCTGEEVPPSVLMHSLTAHARGRHPTAIVAQYGVSDVPASPNGIGRCQWKVPSSAGSVPQGFQPFVTTCVMPAGGSCDFHQDGIGASWIHHHVGMKDLGGPDKLWLLAKNTTHNREILQPHGRVRLVWFDANQVIPRLEGLQYYLAKPTFHPCALYFEPGLWHLVLTMSLSAHCSFRFADPSKFQEAVLHFSRAIKSAWTLPTQPERRVRAVNLREDWDYWRMIPEVPKRWLADVDKAVKALEAEFEEDERMGSPEPVDDEGDDGDDDDDGDEYIP